MNKSGIASSIIGSFEDIGKDVVSQTAKLPGEIAGKALESLGSPKNTKSQTAQAVKVGEGSPDRPKDDWDNIDHKDQNNKNKIARAALAALVKRPVDKKPSVWDQAQTEEKNKKEELLKARKEAEKNLLPKVSYKSVKNRNPFLSGLAGKKFASEASKNVRSD